MVALKCVAAALLLGVCAWGLIRLTLWVLFRWADGPTQYGSVGPEGLRIIVRRGDRGRK